MIEGLMFVFNAAARAVKSFDYFECWLPNESKQKLYYAGGELLSHENQKPLEEFRKISEKFVWDKGIGTPGRVWKSGSTEWQVDASKLPVNMFLRNSYAADAGLKTLVALPVIRKSDGEVQAVGVFFSKTALEYNSRILDTMVTVAQQLFDGAAVPAIPMGAMSFQTSSQRVKSKFEDSRVEVCKRILGTPPIIRTTNEIQFLYEFVEGICFFEQFNEKQRWELCRHLSLRRIEQDDVLYRAAEPGSSAFFVLTGSVEISAPADPDMTPYVLTPGGEFGKSALAADNAVRSHTVVAKLPSDLIVIDRQDYLRAITVPLKDLSFNELAQYFHLSMAEAAKILGVCITVLKKVCRDRGIVRWPYRKVRSLDRAISDLEESLHIENISQSKVDRIRQEIIQLKLERLQLTKEVRCLAFAAAPEGGATSTGTTPRAKPEEKPEPSPFSALGSAAPPMPSAPLAAPSAAALMNLRMPPMSQMAAARTALPPAMSHMMMSPDMAAASLDFLARQMPMVPGMMRNNSAAAAAAAAAMRGNPAFMPNLNPMYSMMGSFMGPTGFPPAGFSGAGASPFGAFNPAFNPHLFPNMLMANMHPGMMADPSTALPFGMQLSQLKRPAPDSQPAAPAKKRVRSEETDEKPARRGEVSDGSGSDGSEAD